ncbi:ACOT8 isoform 6 [Pan troglodytes]|uniref:Acyl-CoA thioesterase 8 n=3 Tax=Pan TaxID=9596 RepID=A0A2I3SHD4_PANTR|nr:ACOT8 isoform 6 [Pan troglodytes]
MSSPQAPEDGQGCGDRGDPPGDLRSVLVTTVLNLEPLDEDLFRGRHYWVPAKRLFGGQIVGQALVAAAKSVSEDVHVHSLHCYFVRAEQMPSCVLRRSPAEKSLWTFTGTRRCQYCTKWSGHEQGRASRCAL